MKIFLVIVCLVDVVLMFELTLLHINDIHVRMDETNKYSATCKAADQRKGACYGGISRLQSLVKEQRRNKNSTLWVNAGDFFQGTAWYSQYKWKVVSKFNNLLNFDAMTLGNHEFDDSIAGLTPFLKEQTVPIVVTNINHTKVPEMEGLYVKSLIKEVDGRRIGLVGYITPETADISNPEQLIFIEEVQALKEEVTKLHNEGVDIIIALGHSGYERDLEIARSVPYLDVVVGGHSHSFLYSETEKKRNPNIDLIIGPYPTLVNNEGGRVLVVQAYAYTKYLGKVDLIFSEGGDLLDWLGDPILLDSSVPKDPEIERELEPWRLNLTEITKEIVGRSKMLLEVGRERETTLGNLLTDIMVWSYENRTIRGEIIRLAIANSGSIRTALEPGNITKGDILQAFPFQNTFDLVTLPGSTLRKVFERSVADLSQRGPHDSGEFLQVSGFKLIYDLRLSPGSRLVEAQVQSSDKGYERLKDGQEYHVVMSDYISRGGDGYKMIKEEKLNQRQGFLDFDQILSYLRIFSPVSSRIQGRIVMKGEIPEEPESTNDANGSRVLSETLIHFCFVISNIFLLS